MQLGNFIGESKTSIDVSLGGGEELWGHTPASSVVVIPKQSIMLGHLILAPLPVTLKKI